MTRERLHGSAAHVLVALAALAALASVAACGGQVSVDSTPAGTPDAAASDAPGVPSFGTSGPTHIVPLTCVPCTANDQCGDLQHGCVASPEGSYCAAGCSKDGFCEAAQQCTWVKEPEGIPWRACLSPAGDPCAHGRPVAAPHAGTW